MQEARPADTEEGRRFLVACVDIDANAAAAGHRHVTRIETRDTAGQRQGWTTVQVIDGIREGFRFVVEEDPHGLTTVLDPALCPRCPLATLAVDPPDAMPIACG